MNDVYYMLTLIESENMKDNNPNCTGDDCRNCSEIDECYSEAIALSNHEFVKSINYGGYDTEEEFWDNLL